MVPVAVPPQRRAYELRAAFLQNGQNTFTWLVRTTAVFVTVPESRNIARTIVETGAVTGALTTGGAAKPGKLVSIFCIPLTFSSLVDTAADLPGPGAVALQGNAQALP